MSKHRETVTILTEEMWVVRRQRHFIRAWCARCGDEVTMLSRSEAARLACMDLAAVDLRVARRDLHVYLRSGYRPYICLRSLALV